MSAETLQLLKRPAGWLSGTALENGIVIGSRIRLARNIEGYNFPTLFDANSLFKVKERILGALDDSQILHNYHIYDVRKLSKRDKQLLIELRLAGNAFLTAGDYAALAVSDDSDLSLLINYEDHVRLQAFAPGLELHKLWKEINEADTCLSRYLPFLFDRKLGYLTSSPKNAGTGLKASVLLHLPVACCTEQGCNVIKRTVKKMGFEINDFFKQSGDIENPGNMYVVSNKKSIGESEQDIISRLQDLISQMVTQEQEIREMMLKNDRNVFYDKIGRAYGILRYGYINGAADVLELLSDIRLGIDMKMLSSIDVATLNELFIKIQRAHLLGEMKTNVSRERECVMRAKLLRDALKAKQI